MIKIQQEEKWSLSVNCRPEMTKIGNFSFTCYCKTNLALFPTPVGVCEHDGLYKLNQCEASTALSQPVLYAFVHYIHDRCWKVISINMTDATVWKHFDV